MSGEEREPTRAAEESCCPACGAALWSVKCKLVCSRCGQLISNCNGD